MTFLLAIWTKAKGYVIAALAFVAAVLAARVYGERKGEAAGVAKVEAKQAQKTAQDVQEARHVELETAQMSDGAAQQKLESTWTR